MRRSIITILALVVLGFVAAALSAQSLLDNEFYKKAQALKAQSDAALAAGDYDAAQAKEQFAKSDAYVAEMLGRYRANGWLQRGNELLAQAKADGKDKSSPDLFGEAAGDLVLAKAAYDGGTYEDSVDFSKRAIATLASIPKPEPVAVTPVVPVVPVEPVEPAGTPELPATYTVQLIPERRDCLWRIAGYPFIYNNPWKWKVLYEANRAILIDPNNPNLIDVGQVLTIPSIAGEVREGDYDYQLEYPVFGVE
jgi:nucleoid-associated protein YgaU